MFDQSYSPRNFRKRVDYENRSGKYIEGLFFPEVDKLSRSIKENNQSFRRLRKKFNDGEITELGYELQKDALDQERKCIKDKRDQELMDELSKVSKDVNSSEFKLFVEKGGEFRGKDVFFIKQTASSFMAIKQLQYNLKRLHAVKQSDRNMIIAQLKAMLDNKFPMYIVRTDIESFYEEINHEILDEKLHESQAHSLTSKRFIRQILSSYRSASGLSKGVPRGVGVSSYFAELYMREFDEIISSSKDLIYYARYVDDIIAVYVPKPNSDKSKYLSFINKQLGFLNLKTHSGSKTKEVDTTINNAGSFDYLGYTFKPSDKGYKLHLRKDKISAYKNKLNKAFDVYDSKYKSNPDFHRRLLIDRVRFITGNIKLHNSKGSVLTGIYHSHKFVDDNNFLEGLDAYLLNIIKRKVGDVTLQRRLRKITFKHGFDDKVFSKFSAQRISKITEVWKHD